MNKVKEIKISKETINKIQQDFRLFVKEKSLENKLPECAVYFYLSNVSLLTGINNDETFLYLEKSNKTEGKNEALVSAANISTNGHATKDSKQS